MGQPQQVFQIGVQQPVSASSLGIDTSSMDQNQLESLEQLVDEFVGVFSTGEHDLGRIDRVYHSIDTGDEAPIKQAPRRLPIHYQQHVGELLEEMQQRGVIEPSYSPWATPVVLVKKKDGSLRFCVDYRRLNSITKKDSHPLPQVDDFCWTHFLMPSGSLLLTSEVATGKWRWTRWTERRQHLPPRTAYTSLESCRLDCAMHPAHSNGCWSWCLQVYDGKFAWPTWMMSLSSGVPGRNTSSGSEQC